MMTKLTGTVVRVLDDEARVTVGPFEYQILISEANRRTLQLRVGQDVTFHLFEYYEGNQTGTRLLPRKIGFLTEYELDFFDLFCTVEKVGVKKALKAMARGVRDIADAVNRGDTRWLTTLPGIGAATAEQMVTTLKRKIAPFLVQRAAPPGGADELPPADAVTTDRKPRGKGKPVAPPEPVEATTGPSESLIEDVYDALMGLGLGPQEARDRVDALLRSGKPFATHSEAIALIFGTRA
jgi:Holliday junction DNA helicase RuvA